MAQNFCGHKFKKKQIRLVQNYPHAQWTSTNPKMQISLRASFLNLMQQQHPGDQCWDIFIEHFLYDFFASFIVSLLFISMSLFQLLQ